MTENQWPQQESDPYRADQYGTTAATASAAAPATTPGSPSKADAAKGEAATVAGHAAGAAENVAQTAKSEVTNVAAEAKVNARDLLHQARSDLTSQAGTQQQKAAEGLHSISSQLRAMAAAPQEQGVASDLVRQVAERSESVASWLGNRDPGSVLDEAKSFARRRPGTFLLLAAGAGLLAGRLGRSLQAGPPVGGTATVTVPPPARYPSTEPGLRTDLAEPYPDEAVLGEPTLGEPRLTGAGPTSSQNLPGGTSSGAPLGDVDDPYTGGGGRPL